MPFVPCGNSWTKSSFLCTFYILFPQSHLWNYSNVRINNIYSPFSSLEGAFIISTYPYTYPGDQSDKNYSIFSSFFSFLNRWSKNAKKIKYMTQCLEKEGTRTNYDYK